MVLNSFPPVTNSLVTQCTPVGLPIILPQGGQPPLQLAAISDPFFSPPFPSNQVPTPPQEPRQFVSLPYYDPQPPPTITQDFHAPAPSQSSVHQTAAIHHQDLNSHPLVHRTASSPARVSRQPAPYRILSSAVAGTSCQLHVAPESVSNLQVAQNDTLASGLPAPQMSEPRRSRDRVSEEDRKRRLQACEVCRKARHKCEEGGIDENLPCKRCRSKGITCVWSSKKRMFGRQGLNAQRKSSNQTSAREISDINQALVNNGIPATHSPMCSERSPEPRRAVSDTVIAASASSQRPSTVQTVPSPFSARQLANQYLQLIVGQTQASQQSDATGSQFSPAPLPWRIMAPQQLQDQSRAIHPQDQQEQQQLVLEFTEFASTDDGNSAANGGFQHDSLVRALYPW
ncbi:hypothetical protein I314_05221 [Cryptococcus bacillisporus CA1873]|uniref:Zn(2)-C6 fungal-type domain-containing protein n=1 Tax=Cryptococcus bacillisporus CA1873 TaxID=1296111 RepID=A0ABR5B5G0_CRYGA|nr:hypothetical protein I314_05221 [Cryptococcus bacillisporus CA1873]|eukprot:KIR58809.1 hypothetical protein I314_05221 [Cryptococcus gattii CA1873]